MHSINATTESQTDSSLHTMLCMLVSHRGVAEGILVSLIAHYGSAADLGQLLPVKLASSCAHTLGSFSQASRRLSIMFHLQAEVLKCSQF